jgi:hypothetical protein
MNKSGEFLGSSKHGPFEGTIMEFSEGIPLTKKNKQRNKTGKKI